ncbi:hypothetical protein L596_009286 [Steinernema carpocapsae]|uniref:Uncharacterized protein n=1 Tax=Steinernema carpocapsae TaxID=34508 RepID=A0A4U5PF33_STECR|nr:hypothetical protein L596_009286 [Steinernema carpocapsae]
MRKHAVDLPDTLLAAVIQLAVDLPKSLSHGEVLQRLLVVLFKLRSLPVKIVVQEARVQVDRVPQRRELHCLLPAPEHLAETFVLAI